MSKNIHVADAETLANLFILVAKDVDTKEIKKFVVHEDRDDRDSLYSWLDTKPSLITFNGLQFDYPVLHYIMVRKDFLKECIPSRFCQLVHEQALEIIDSERPEIWKRMLGVQDLYRIHHFDNKSKHASLKWVQCNIKWHNVEEMPVDYQMPVDDDDVVPLINYCVNDVESTMALWEDTKEMIKLRKSLGKKYGLNLINANDPKMGEQILINMIAGHMNVPVSDLKDARTYRNRVAVKDCLLPISFNNEKLGRVVDIFERLNVEPSEFKGALEHTVVYDEMYYNFGLGGLHACREPGIYKPYDGIELIESDVKSYYPNLAITNGFAPKHLGKDFGVVYKQIYEDRQQYRKGSPENYGLKIALNGAYGKSNDEYSPLLDPKFTLQITCNGQLKLAQLCEMQTKAGNRIIYANTDGVIAEVSDKKAYMEICKEWEKRHNGLVLEHDEVKVAAIRDVNNLFIQYAHDGVKAKGDYELNETRFLNQDFSFNIVRKAVLNFILKGTPPEETIRGCEDVFDFCLMARAKSGDYFEMRYLKGDEVSYVKEGRVIRYLIVKTGGGVLAKKFKKGSEQIFHRGYRVRMQKQIVDTDASHYNLDYSWYEKEAQKLIRPLLKTQLQLF